MLAPLEALLFVAGRSLTIKELAKLLAAEESAVLESLEILQKKYNDGEAGLQLMWHADKVSLVTTDGVAEVVKKFLQAEAAGELTRPALETLSVVAYRGPVTRPEIEQIRGVNCSLILRNLMVRGLVEEIYNEQNEQSYRVTSDFVKHLGITNIAALPNYEDLRHHPELEKALLTLSQDDAATASPANS